jgi:hypothetical protein
MLYINFRKSIFLGQARLLGIANNQDIEKNRIDGNTKICEFKAIENVCIPRAKKLYQIFQQLRFV